MAMQVLSTCDVDESRSRQMRTLPGAVMVLTGAGSELVLTTLTRPMPDARVATAMLTLPFEPAVGVGRFAAVIDPPWVCRTKFFSVKDVQLSRVLVTKALPFQYWERIVTGALPL